MPEEQLKARYDDGDLETILMEQENSLKEVQNVVVHARHVEDAEQQNNAVPNTGVYRTAHMNAAITKYNYLNALLQATQRSYPKRSACPA